MGLPCLQGPVSLRIPGGRKGGIRSGLITFAPGLNLRTVIKDNEPWFVAADVAQLLYGVTTGLSNVFARLDRDEQIVVSRAEGTYFPLFGRSPAARLKLVSESGLYKLIMRSDKPEARAFQDWVTKVVLPAIRKDGAYVMGEEKVATWTRSE